MAQLIGTAANQVPLNGMLGSMAFQDKSSIRVDSITADGLIQSTVTGFKFPDGTVQVSAVSTGKAIAMAMIFGG